MRLTEINNANHYQIDSYKYITFLSMLYLACELASLVLSFKIIEFKENQVFDYFGFFPEFRFFFNPYLPKKITYEHDGTIFNKNGDFKMQTSYGYGGGIFFKTKTGLIALKVEINSNDPFEVLRNLDYGQKVMPFSKREQFLISLRLSGF